MWTESTHASGHAHAFLHFLHMSSCFRPPPFFFCFVFLFYFLIFISFFFFVSSNSSNSPSLLLLLLLRLHLLLFPVIFIFSNRNWKRSFWWAIWATLNENGNRYKTSPTFTWWAGILWIAPIWDPFTSTIAPNALFCRPKERAVVTTLPCQTKRPFSARLTLKPW